MESCEVVVIGGGPSGIAAAIQLKRYNINTILFEENRIGGLLHNANLVENYPGFPKGITGSKLIDLFYKQLSETGANPRFERVDFVDHKNTSFLIRSDKSEIECKYLVLATGTKPHKISIPGLDKILGKKAYYDIVPIMDKSNKLVSIIGAGDAAFDYALNLSRNNTVQIYNRGKSVKCLPLLWDRSEKNSNISYFESTLVEKVISIDDKLTLNLRDNNRVWNEQPDFLILAIGRVPNLELIEKLLGNRVKELVEADRLFLVGDVKNDLYRQVGISVGDGIRAAMKIYNEVTK